jgi:hypothetical protein
MTEEEAKAKWCPFARDAAVISRNPPVAITANRESGEHYGVHNVNCIGRDCMAWSDNELGGSNCRLMRWR